MNLPVEATELAVPIRFLRYGLDRGSGGAGQHQGGDGVAKSFECLADSLVASLLGERTLSRAHGVAGGDEGGPARFALERADGETVSLGAKSGPHRLRRGDRLHMITASGGGWGRSEGE